jgi:hypothetical protein
MSHGLVHDFLSFDLRGVMAHHHVLSLGSSRDFWTLDCYSGFVVDCHLGC